VKIFGGACVLSWTYSYVVCMWVTVQYALLLCSLYVGYCTVCPVVCMWVTVQYVLLLSVCGLLYSNVLLLSVCGLLYSMSCCCLYVGYCTVCPVVVSFSHCYLLYVFCFFCVIINCLMFFNLLVLCSFYFLVCFAFCFVCSVFFVLFLPLYIVGYFLFVFNCTDHCHRVETQKQLLNILSYDIMSYHIPHHK
jgi:hypothetical protein